MPARRDPRGPCPAARFFPRRYTLVEGLDIVCVDIFAGFRRSDGGNAFRKTFGPGGGLRWRRQKGIVNHVSLRSFKDEKWRYRHSPGLLMNIGIAKDENGMLRKIVFERDFGWRPGGIREVDRDERYRFQLRNRLFDRQQDTRAVGTPFIAHDQRCNGNARRAGQHDPDFKMVDPASNETDPCRIYGKQLLSVLNVDGVKL